MLQIHALEEPTETDGVCSFAHNLLAGSYLGGRGKIPCNGNYRSLKDLELEDVSSLLQRCGRHLSDFSEFEYKICDKHFELLFDTMAFGDRYRQYCLWPDHKKGAQNAKDLKTISLQEVQDLWKFTKKIIPYGGKVCKTCRTHFLSKQRTTIKIKKQELDAQYAELRNESFEFNEIEDPSPSRSTFSDTSWQLDLKAKWKEMRLNLNRLIVLNMLHRIQ